MRWFCSLIVVLALFSVGPPLVFTAEPAKVPDQVSYYRDIRPIFQLHCQGCHQPAKAQGGFVMTSYEALLKTGDSGVAGIVPNKPADSYIFEQITPQRDKPPEMPKNKDGLIERDVHLIKKWIEQGAKDDTPASARQIVVDQEHPPTYALPPVIPSLAFSPDGQLLAVAGYHEVLLHKADGSGLVARLVGMSERVQSVAFSPDGRRLAVTGGNPGRFGEVQIWEIDRDALDLTPLIWQEIPIGDIKKTTLKLSVPVTFDTVYGVSWSPDGTKIAFG